MPQSDEGQVNVTVEREVGTRLGVLDETMKPIEEMVVTDTISYRFEPLPSKVRILSVAPLFAKGIWNIYSRTSISSLFTPPSH